jgi:3-isopropylmalate/(R)-2-methylmalate dehydratase small subunit
MGAGAVLADSFARIFFRNGINLGLPLIVCKGIAKHVKDGQTVHLDILKGTVTIQETGEILQAEALGDKAMEILSAGGIKPMMRAKYGR